MHLQDINDKPSSTGISIHGEIDAVKPESTYVPMFLDAPKPLNKI